MENEKQGHVVGFNEAEVARISGQAQQQEGGTSLHNRQLGVQKELPRVDIGTKLDDLYYNVDILDSEVGQLLGRLQCLMPAIPQCSQPEEQKQYEESEFVNRIQTITDKVVMIANTVNETNQNIQI